MVGVFNVGLLFVDLFGVRVDEFFILGFRSGLECKICLNFMFFGKKIVSLRVDWKDFIKIKELFCGFLFNCYIVCLFVFGLNVFFLS